MVKPFLIFGHRGSPTRFPENTLASFDEALRAGADGFETDLRLLADGTAVLFHDDEIGDVPVESFSAATLPGKRAAIERLDALSTYSGRTTMVLEIKRSKWEDVVFEHVSDWRNIILASFDHSIIDTLHRRHVPVPLGITVYGSIIELADYAVRLGATWCFPEHRYADEEMVASLHGRGVKVVPWTANRVRDWDRLSAAGCDGVITDVPHEAVAWRSQA